MTRSPDSTPISSLRTMAFVFLLKISIVLSSGSLWAEGTEETSPPADPPAERCLALVDGEPRDEPMYRTLQIAESMVFVEAPMLSARVAAGELPPVEERVGSDPQVVQPACEVGDYGGTLTGTRSLIGGSHQPIAKWLSPAPFMADGSLGYAPRLYPNVVREWEIADDGRLLTLHLRRGMKWSDGLPVTADDFFFWYESILRNDRLTPNIPERYRSGRETMTMKVLDRFTVQYRFSDPKPDVVFQWAQHRVLAPKHYLSEYHIDYNDDADKDAHAAGFDSWDKRFIHRYGGDRNWLYGALPETPTVDTFVPLSSDDETEQYERNPYFWKIDPDGKQLPYIDHLVIFHRIDYDTLLLRVISGHIDFSILGIDGLPSLKEKHELGEYRLLEWHNGAISTPLAITLNYTHPDPTKRDLFNNPDLRKALSLAIDRGEMAEVLYSGLSEPWTPSVPPHWTGFEDWMPTHYANYDVAESNRLLDGIGLTIGNGRVRRLPDGNTFTIRGAYTDADLKSGLELLRKYWMDVGIILEVKWMNEMEWRDSIFKNNLDATFAHTYGGAEVFARLWRHPMRLVPPWHRHEYPSESSYMWSDWYATGGRDGNTPPDEIRKLFGHSDWFKANAHLSPDTPMYKETVHRMLELNVEGLYSFGTVSTPPIIVAVNKDIRNIPENAIWLFGGMQPFNVDTFFFVVVN